MAKNSTYDDLIENYLEGSLSEAERKDFEEQLKADQLLSEKLSERLIIQKAWIKVDQHDNVKRHIAQLIKIEKYEIKSRTTRWLAAASLILLISTSSVLFIRYNPKGDGQNFQAGNKGTAGNKHELMVSGQKNEIRKFGSSDSIQKISSVELYFPKDGTTFSSADTITFSWPAKSLKEKLVIFDENWNKVKEVKISKGVTEYKVAPQRLKPGAYTWILTPNSLKYQFSVK